MVIGHFQVPTEIHLHTNQKQNDEMTTVAKWWALKSSEKKTEYL